MEYIIRPIEEKDLDRLIELCDHHAEYEQATYDATGKKPLLKEALFRVSPKLYCQVIEIDSLVMGYFSYTFDFSTWNAQTYMYLDCLYLEQEVRGMGIGKEIFLVLQRIGLENNCVNIQWQTPVFNEKAINFYRKIGASEKDKKRFTLDLQKGS